MADGSTARTKRSGARKTDAPTPTDPLAGAHAQGRMAAGLYLRPAEWAELQRVNR